MMSYFKNEISQVKVFFCYTFFVGKLKWYLLCLFPISIFYKIPFVCLPTSESLFVFEKVKLNRLHIKASSSACPVITVVHNCCQMFWEVIYIYIEQSGAQHTPLFNTNICKVM